MSFYGHACIGKLVDKSVPSSAAGRWLSRALLLMSGARFFGFYVCFELCNAHMFHRLLRISMVVLLLSLLLLVAAVLCFQGLDG